MTGTVHGVHSEVGTLRKVLVCAPGLAHTRLTPSNCDALLFDDVMWVQNARRDHFDFMSKMRERGVEVVELHNLLAETLDIPEAKKWLLDRQIVADLMPRRPDACETWAREGVKGEIVLVIGGATPAPASLDDAVADVLARVAAGERLKDAAAAVADETGRGKRELYDAALAARRG